MKRQYIAMLMSGVMICSQFSGAAMVAAADEIVIEEDVLPALEASDTSIQDIPEIQDILIQEDIAEVQDTLIQENLPEDPDVLVPEVVDVPVQESMPDEIEATEAYAENGESSQEDVSEFQAAGLNLEDGELLLEGMEEVEESMISAASLEEEEDGPEEAVFFEGLRAGEYTWIFSDEDMQFRLNIGGISEDTEYTVRWMVGTWSEDAEGIADALQPENGFYTVDTDNSITLHGSRLAEEYGADSENSRFSVLAEVVAAENEIIAITAADVEIRNPKYDYNLPTCDDQLLHWRFDIDKNINCWVENKDYPYGENVQTQITNVAVTVDEGNEEAVTVEPYEDGTGWSLCMNSYGHANVRVTYMPIDSASNPGEFSFDFWVGQDNWEINLESSTGTERMLPGSDMDLTAAVRHYCFTEDEGYFDGDTSSVELEWSLDVDNVVSINQDPENPNICHVSAFMEAEADKEAWISVRAYLLDENGDREKDEEGKDIAVADAGYRVEIQQSYFNIVPVNLEKRNLGVDETITYDPVLQQVWTDENGTTQTEEVPDVRYRWEWDPEAVEITGAEGNVLAQEAGDGGSAPFTLRKLQNQNTEIRIIAEISDENGNYDEVCRREWELREVDYDISFGELRGGNHTWVFSDEDLFLTLNTENLTDKKDCTVDWIVGSWDENVEKIVDPVSPGDGYYTVSDDGLSITLHGAKLAEQFVPGSENSWCNVEATVKAGGVEVSETGTGVDVRDPVCDYDYPRSWPGGESILKDDDFFIDKMMDVYVEDKEHPEGEETKTEITNIKIEQGIWDEENWVPAEEDEIYLFCEQQDDGWHFRGESYGCAKVEITYNKVDTEESDTYEFIIYVLADTWTLEYDYPENSHDMLPNSEMILPTRLLHRWKNEDDSYEQKYVEDYWLEINCDEEGKVCYDTNLITAEVVANENGDLRNLKICSNDGMWGTSIFVSAYVEGENGKLQEICAANIGVNVNDCYQVIRTQAVTAAPGETILIEDAKPELIEYTVENPEGKSLDVAGFIFIQPGDERLQVSEAGDTVTIAENAVDGENSPDETGMDIAALDEDGEEIATDWCQVILCAHDWDEGRVTKEATCIDVGEKTYTCEHCGSVKTEELEKTGHTETIDAAVAATCTAAGKTEGSHCSVCGQTIKAQQTVAALGHKWNSGVITKAATCVSSGEKTFTCTRCGSVRTEELAKTGHTAVKDAAVAATCTSQGKTEGSHCSVCGQTIKAQQTVAMLAHTWNSGEITKEPTCVDDGIKTYTCTRCYATWTESVPRIGHILGIWQTVSEATVFAPASQTRTCSVCGAAETQSVGAKLTPTIKLNATSIPLNLKQSTTKVKVSGLAAGDYITSWKSSNTKVVTVNSKGKITAKNKAGKAVVTVSLASGLSAKIKVTVQKAAVKTTKISGLAKKVTLQKGKKLTLAPVITPITSLEKVTYASSNKKVAAVSSKGVVTAKAAGTAKITVKSGKKKAVVTVVVAKTPATGISKVPAAVSLKKGKTYKLKPKLVPASSEEKITYASSNKKVATVDKNGKITGKKAGTAVITVKAGKVSTTCTVTVK